MAKEKKKPVREEEEHKPISKGGQHPPSGGRVSGSANSVGGSREGNVGHESSSESGRGDRQV